MDIIEHCLALTPVPGLAAAFSILRYIASSVIQAQASKQQLIVLTTVTAQLMMTLNAEFDAGRLSPDKSAEPLYTLQRLLKQISKFVQQQSTHSFLKSMYIKEHRITQIDSYHRQIETLATSFKISALLKIQDWQTRNDSARAKDQDELISRLDELDKNQNKLLATLNAQQSNFLAIMASLQRHLQQQSLDDRERQFYQSSLHHISILSGSHVELKGWMVTSYDVDFGSLIGSGGFGQVFEGVWNKTPVALKVLKADGVAPSSMVIRREIDTWSNIRHPHVLQFLGANVLDERPFIVMPYLKNGNARTYLEEHPNCDRLLILHHILLGIVHLHSINVVHGDLKAMNVLIDDGGKAVLCDFGLSRIKADATSRTATHQSSVAAGSRNWMSPERLSGGLARKPADVYAFGMTVYEIYTNEIPLGHIDPGEFTQLVAREDVRPERPLEDEAPQLTDAVWCLAEDCWAKSVQQRPNASAICDAVFSLLDTSRISPLVATPSAPSATISSPSQPELHTVSPAVRVPRPLPRRPFTHHSLASIPSFRKPFLRVFSHASLVWSVAFSPDGNRVASGSRDKTLRVWDAQTGQEMVQAVPQSDSVRYVSFSPDGKSIVSLSAGAISIWHAGTGQLMLVPFDQTKEIWSPIFSPVNARQIAFGSSNSTVRIIDIETQGPACATLTGHSGKVYSVAFSPDGMRLVSGSADKTIRIWNIKTRVAVVGQGHDQAVYSVAFSPDGSKLASGSWDRTVIVWEASTASFLHRLFGHTDWVNCVAFSPDGRYIASASDDKTIHVWDASTGSLVVPLKWHTERVYSVAFSPGGERIASGSADGTICIGHWKDFQHVLK